MKLNRVITATLYRIIKDASTIEFGWYFSGKAFIAKDGEIMLFSDAYREFAPKNQFATSKKFYEGISEYYKTMDGLVRYLIDKYCKSEGGAQ